MARKRAKKRGGSYGKYKALADEDIREWTELLNSELTGIQNATVKGIKEAVNLIGDEALELTPVDTNALYYSQYRIVDVTKNGVTGYVGYYTGDEQIPKGEVILAPSAVAPYAVYVHEIPPSEREDGTLRYAHKPPTRWKFLTEAFGNKFNDVIKILTANMLKKPRK